MAEYFPNTSTDGFDDQLQSLLEVDVPSGLLSAEVGMIGSVAAMPVRTVLAAATSGDGHEQLSKLVDKSLSFSEDEDYFRLSNELDDRSDATTERVWNQRQSAPSFGDRWTTTSAGQQDLFDYGSGVDDYNVAAAEGGGAFFDGLDQG